MNIVPFGMAYIQVRLLFVSGFTTMDCFSLPRNALQVDCLRKRNFDEVEEVHLMHGVVLHRWPGGRRGWLCVWALARMKPITYTPSCHLKLPANAPKNRPSPKGNSSSNHPFFRGELLNFGGVTNPQNITQESKAWKMSNTDHVHPRKFHSTYDNHNNFLWHSQKRRR